MHRTGSGAEPVKCKNLVKALGSVAYIHTFFGPERGCLFLQSGKSISTGSGIGLVKFGAHQCIFVA